jgi:AraC-like DNA-binding protein
LRHSSIRARGGMPSQFRLDLSVEPGNAREFDLWRSAMSPLFAMDAPDAETRSSFGAQLTSYQFADVAIVSGRSSAATLQRTAQHIARSGIDNIGVVVYAEGGCALDLEGRAAEVHAGDVCFLDLSRPIDIKAPDYESLTLMLPRVALQQHIADLDGLHGQILRKTSPLNAILVGHLRTLFEAAPSLDSTDGRAAANGTAALIAAFAGPSANGRDTIAQSKSITSLNTVRQLIEANLHRLDLGPDFICRQLGISRAKLYRVFEPMDGVSHYILQRRLTLAHQLISNPANAHHRIGEIAARCGFANISVFSRSFRQSYGMSPTELLRTVEGAEPADVRFSGESGFGTMSRWLLGLDTTGH